MNPYPLYYCPPGTDRPAHCPHAHALRVQDGKGPDGKTGTIWSADGQIPSGLEWTPTKDGWWFLLGAQRPQDLIRLHTSPRIVRWHALPGVEQGHAWRIPVLLTPQDPSQPDTMYVSGLDRIWRGGDYGTPQNLKDAQVALLHVAHHIALGTTPDERNAALADLAVAILSLGHHVSRYEIIHKGWLSEQLIADIPLVALDRLDLALSAKPLDA